MNPTSSELGVWVMIALMVLNALAGVAVAWVALRNSPQQRSVQINDRSASKDELQREVASVNTRIDAIEGDFQQIRCEMREDLQGLREKMEQDKDTILRAGEERSANLHKRTDQILAAVSELRGQINGHSRGGNQ